MEHNIDTMFDVGFHQNGWW